MDIENKRDISREYFSRERLAEHHFRSFNAFLDLLHPPGEEGVERPEVVFCESFT